MHILHPSGAVLIVCFTALASGCGTAPGIAGNRTPRSLTPALAGHPASGSGVVLRVVDGDTLDVAMEGVRVRVRLLGIDTPETVKPGAPVGCYGPQASARTKHLLPPGVRVRVDTDPRVGLYDRYHRVLAYVRPDGARETVNELLLRQGFARLYVFDPVHPFARAPRFTRLAAGAQRARDGLWGACPS